LSAEAAEPNTSDIEFLNSSNKRLIYGLRQASNHSNLSLYISEQTCASAEIRIALQEAEGIGCLPVSSRSCAHFKERRAIDTFRRQSGSDRQANRRGLEAPLSFLRGNNGRSDSRQANRVTVEKRKKIMPLMQIVVALVVVGVLLWLVNAFIPMAGSIKSILNAVVVIAVVLWLLSVSGLLHSLSHIRIGT
jgi:ABC-type multidrug transport system fused ATPase/permease subunit